MIKRVIIAALILILVGAVGVGAYDAYQGNSSLDLGVDDLFSSSQAQGRGQGQGQGQSRGHRQGQGQGGGQGQGREPGQGRGKGQSGAQGQGQGNTSGQPQAAQHNWVTLVGEVVAANEQNLMVSTAEMGQLTVLLGPPGFASQQGVTFNPGDAVTLLGFSGENNMFQAGQITNDTSGQMLLLRDPNGRPLWAGRGQGGGGGAGQGQGQGQGQSF
jgi:hypothetical protein